MKGISSIIGKQYGDYIVMEYKFNKKANHSTYTIKCLICGHEKQVYNLTRLKHSLSNCKYDYAKEHLGEIIGDYKIIKYIENSSRLRYEVQCLICGRKKELDYRDLLINNEHRLCVNLIDKNIKKTKEFKTFYNRWSALRQRTTYENYQGRKYYENINSDDFRYFIDFYDNYYDDFLKAVELYGLKNATTDRIDNHGDYCIGNIRFVPMSIQRINQG